MAWRSQELSRSMELSLQIADGVNGNSGHIAVK